MYPYLILLATWAGLLFAAPATLSATGLYQDTAAKTIASSNRSYTPQYPLWSDGAEKHRWIYLPPGLKIQTGNAGGEGDPWTGTPDFWLFPVGTKIWKEFQFRSARGDLKRIETRYMVKNGEEDWEFATYLWNKEETEAVIASEEGLAEYLPIAGGTTHDIPSVAQCLRCHRRGGDPVLGFDAIQLSSARDPLAPHLEPLKSGDLTLVELLQKNLLSYPSPQFENGLLKIPSKNAEERAVMGYFHANCGTCHNPNGTSMHIQMDLRHSLSPNAVELLPAFSSVVGQFTQIAVLPGENKSYRVLPGQPEKSVVLFQMKTNGTQHMPPLGAEQLDTEAVQLIEKWISQLTH